MNGPDSHKGTNGNDEIIQCKACPDGSVWTPDGPTHEVCPFCNGYAEVHKDETPLTEEEFNGR